MTDISKCNGSGCPLKEKCWRYLAPSSSWQSMIVAAYADGTCRNFWGCDVEKQGEVDNDRK